MRSLGRFTCATLGDIADFYGGASLPEGEPFTGQADGYFLLRVSDLNAPQNQTIISASQRWSETRGAKSATAPPGSLIIPKRGGAIGTNKKRIANRPCVLDPNLMAISPHPDKLDLRFLYHWFLTFDLISIASGSSVPQINKQDLRPLQLPIPSIDEQRRIAEILDQADELRVKRLQAIALLDDLGKSIFLDMFGSPRANNGEWRVEPFGAQATEPSRNGLSPLKGGTVNARVLTLSAITGDAFDGSAAKVSTFMNPPPPAKRVDKRDFLVCRGNGNLRLVGRGFFPNINMPETTFPDTMIATRISPDRLGREYLEHVWRSFHVREQIEAGARTTNGTFKINQKTLESILLPIPPLSLQQDFGHRIRRIGSARQSQLVQLRKLDELFASLQHRAFSGEL